MPTARRGRCSAGRTSWRSTRSSPARTSTSTRGDAGEAVGRRGRRAPRRRGLALPRAARLPQVGLPEGSRRARRDPARGSAARGAGGDVARIARAPLGRRLPRDRAVRGREGRTLLRRAERVRRRAAAGVAGARTARAPRVPLGLVCRGAAAAAAAPAADSRLGEVGGGGLLGSVSRLHAGRAGPALLGWSAAVRRAARRRPPG